MIVGVGTGGFDTSIYTNLSNDNLFDAEFTVLFYKFLPVCLSFLGIFSAFFLYYFKSNFLFKIKVSIIGKKLYNFLNRKWFFDKIYNEFLGQFFLNLVILLVTSLLIEVYFEILGPTGLYLVALNIGNNLHKLQTDYLYHYI